MLITRMKNHQIIPGFSYLIYLIVVCFHCLYNIIMNTFYHSFEVLKNSLEYSILKINNNKSDK